MKRDAVLNVFGKWTEKVLKWRRQEERSRHARQRQTKNDVHGAVFMTQSHCESSLGSCDECRTAPDGCRPLDQAYGLEPLARLYAAMKLHPPSPLLLLSPADDTHFTIPQRIEGWVDLDGWLHTQTVYLPASSHPSKYTGPVSINYVDWSQRANHNTTPPYTIDVINVYNVYKKKFFLNAFIILSTFISIRLSHSNLRLVDKLEEISYSETTVPWFEQREFISDEDN